MALLRLPEELTQFADGRLQLEMPGSTVGDVVSNACGAYPNLQMRILNVRGEFYSYLPAFLNEQKLPLRNFAAIPINDDDVLEFIVMASGG